MAITSNCAEIIITNPQGSVAFNKLITTTELSPAKTVDSEDRVYLIQNSENAPQTFWWNLEKAIADGFADLEELYDYFVAEIASQCGGGGENISNADLTSDADHTWDLSGHSQGIGNIGEYFVIGDPEADGGFLIIPGDNISMLWVDNNDEDTPIYSNQVALGTKQSQIAVSYNENVNYAGAVAEKDRFQILVKNDTDTATIIVEPEVINIQGKTTSNDDIEMSDSTKGIILTSPDNTKWRITVSNIGVITATSI